MSKRPSAELKIDAGDLEVFHPPCRTRILITNLEVRRDGTKKELSLVVEGICPKCDKYTHLRLTESGL